MLHGFERAEVETDETSILAPLLARRYTVVCADLRGYGRSGCPASTLEVPEETAEALEAFFFAAP